LIIYLFIFAQNKNANNNSIQRPASISIALEVTALGGETDGNEDSEVTYTLDL
jgi:hypothetical protein